MWENAFVGQLAGSEDWYLRRWRKLMQRAVLSLWRRRWDGLISSLKGIAWWWSTRSRITPANACVCLGLLSRLVVSLFPFSMLFLVLLLDIQVIVSPMLWLICRYPTLVLLMGFPRRPIWPI